MHGQEPTYCVHSLSLTQSITHSVTTSHTHPPTLLSCSSFILLHTLTHFFTLSSLSVACLLTRFPANLSVLAAAVLQLPPHQDTACSVQQGQLYDNKSVV